MEEKVNLTLIPINPEISKANTECTLIFSNESPCTIQLKHETIGRYIFSDSDLYATFLRLKAFLEKEGYNILCNGSRIDAFPSTMSLQMSGGEDLYVVEIGYQVSSDSIVYIFDVPDVEKIATLAEKESYYQKWIDSTDETK